ncbi:hypothetical protein [Novosphingobium jiangmenense]|uniref:Uncharacterized protein n=1 Tax=Novosphingobium jiangmenense TaxID=2791981 RepID=A0ABS0HL90_9SPHN|nr:hypothetical protein [Novosphingobium jiangmenense]MBF9153025.1 hypothetical protein [Novosphingobium jiangmenense]
MGGFAQICPGRVTPPFLLHRTRVGYGPALQYALWCEQGGVLPAAVAKLQVFDQFVNRLHSRPRPVRKALQEERKVWMSVQEVSHDPAVLMKREMRVRLGIVPDKIADAFFDDQALAISKTEFIFVTLEDVRFHYRVGQGLTVQLPEGTDSLTETDFELFLWGTVFGAIAWLNGLVPLHASAVEVNGRAVAFTADSGGGKSTLAAGLARLGLPHVCDDTLVLATAGSIMAMPDGKPLKLWDDALLLTGMEAERPIQSMPGKHYANAALKAGGTLPLTDLYFLERGESVEVEQITGARKLAMLPEALYRNFVHAARGDRSAHEQFLLGFCSQVRFWKLRRPFDSRTFSADLLKVKDIIATP